MKLGTFPVRLSFRTEEKGAWSEIKQLPCAVYRARNGETVIIALLQGKERHEAMLVLKLDEDDIFTVDFQAFDLEYRFLAILKREFPEEMEESSCS